MAKTTTNLYICLESHNGLRQSSGLAKRNIQKQAGVQLLYTSNPLNLYTLPETNIAPANEFATPKGDFIFQPSIFKGYLSCREGKSS